jgi:hypothetical protein
VITLWVLDAPAPIALGDVAPIATLTREITQGAQLIK